MQFSLLDIFHQNFVPGKEVKVEITLLKLTMMLLQVLVIIKFLTVPGMKCDVPNNFILFYYKKMQLLKIIAS